MNILTSDEVDSIIKAISVTTPKVTKYYEIEQDGSIIPESDLEDAVESFMHDNDCDSCLAKEFHVINVKTCKIAYEVDSTADVSDYEYGVDEEFTVHFPNGSYESYDNPSDAKEAIEEYILYHPSSEDDDFRVTYEATKDFNADVTVSKQMKIEYE